MSHIVSAIHFFSAVKDTVVVTPSELHIPQGTPDSSLKTILQIVFALAAAISVLVITIAGFQMVVSQGNPEQVNKARNAVLYAVIGLVICALAFTIVTFVMNKI